MSFDGLLLLGLAFFLPLEEEEEERGRSTARKNGPGTWQRGHLYGAGAGLLRPPSLLSVLPPLLPLILLLLLPLQLLLFPRSGWNADKLPRESATATVCSYQPKMLQKASM